VKAASRIARASEEGLLDQRFFNGDATGVLPSAASAGGRSADSESTRHPTARPVKEVIE
jgi:hypothetical protein